MPLVGRTFLEKLRERGWSQPKAKAWSFSTTSALKADSTARAIAKAQDAGMRVLCASCLADRQQGAAELLGGKGIELASIFTLAELAAHKHELHLATGIQ
jgi:hypothetical protein